MKANSNNSKKIKRMTVVALFCAMSFIVSLIFPIKVSFLTLDFKDTVSAICGMLFGPVAGLFCAVVVPCIEFTFSDTGAYGLIMNLLSSIAFVGVSSLIYKYKKSLGGAIAALLSGAVATVAVMMLANLYITPFYMGVTQEKVISLIPTLILPFNAVKTLLNASVTMLIYKPISRLMKKMGVDRAMGESGADTAGSGAGRGRVLAASGLSAAVLVVSLLILFLVLGGKIA